MLLRDCMTTEVEMASPEMSLHIAAQLMKEGDIGVLPAGDHDRLVGMITDRDTVTRGLANGQEIPRDQSGRHHVEECSLLFRGSKYRRRGKKHGRQSNPKTSRVESRKTAGWNCGPRRLGAEENQES
jgi:hypothetical protein